MDGWLRTGDVGYVDEDGYVFLVDRIKDLIICSGFNVYPRIIEEALLSHPAVDETNVIGVPASCAASRARSSSMFSEERLRSPVKLSSRHSWSHRQHAMATYRSVFPWKARADRSHRCAQASIP